MKVKDTNPYSKNYGEPTEAEVTFEYKGYSIKVDTNGTVLFHDAVTCYTITDAFDKTWRGNGSVEDAINYIHNMEKTTNRN